MAQTFLGADILRQAVAILHRAGLDPFIDELLRGLMDCPMCCNHIATDDRGVDANTQHVLAVVDQLTSRGIGFRSLTEGLHTDGPMGTAMLTIMAAFAQLERDTMIERTRAGLAAAAANGRKGGRPRKVDDADAARARQLRQKGITATDIAKMLGVSRATVYRYLADDASLAM